MRGIEARRPVQKDRLGIDDEPGPLLKFDEILPLGGKDIIFGTVIPDEVIASFGIHIPGRGVEDGPRRTELVLDPDFLANAGGNDRLIGKMAVDDLPEKSSPHKIDESRVLDGRGLAIDRLLALIHRSIEIIGEPRCIDAEKR